MASYTNQTKNSTAFANQAFGSANLTWDDANFSWDQAVDLTWDKPGIPFINATKTASSFSNQSKN